MASRTPVVKNPVKSKYSNTHSLPSCKLIYIYIDRYGNPPCVDHFRRETMDFPHIYIYCSLLQGKSH